MVHIFYLDRMIKISLLQIPIIAELCASLKHPIVQIFLVQSLCHNQVRNFYFFVSSKILFIYFSQNKKKNRWHWHYFLLWWWNGYLYRWVSYYYLINSQICWDKFWQMFNIVRERYEFLLPWRNICNVSIICEIIILFLSYTRHVSYRI